MKNTIRFLSRLILLSMAISVLIVPLQITGAQSPVQEEPGSSSDAPLLAPQTVAAVTAISGAFSGGPAYDSGWVSLRQNEARVLYHNLGISENSYVVDMQYRNSSVEGINQRYYGGFDIGTHPSIGLAAEDRAGGYWRSLTSTSITVYRRSEDIYAEQVRIRLWVSSPTDYDSGWISLAVNTTQTLTHDLGGNVDDFVVDMQFKSGSVGINQRYYGGCDNGSQAQPGKP